MEAEKIAKKICRWCMTSQELDKLHECVNNRDKPMHRFMKPEDIATKAHVWAYTESYKFKKTRR